MPATCPKCGAPLRGEGQRMVCPNVACPYTGYDVPKKIDITKILNENAILKRKLVEIREAVESAQTQGRKLADIQFLLDDEHL